MRVVIAGCGRVGSDLALTLAEHGHDVSVIDNRPQMLARLGSTFNGTVHPGLAYDVGVLEEAGIEFADAFVAATDSDNANLMAVQVAKQVFRVPRTISRLEDGAREEAYRALDIDFVAGASLVSRVIFGQITEPGLAHHVTFTQGDVEVVELVLGPGAAGATVADLESEEVRVAAVQRGGEVRIAVGGMALRPGDVVVAAARFGARRRLGRYLRAEDG